MMQYAKAMTLGAAAKGMEALGSLGNVVTSVADGLSKLVGGKGTLDSQLEALKKMSSATGIDAQKVKDVAKAMGWYAAAMVAGAPASLAQGAASLGNLVTNIGDGLSKLIGGKSTLDNQLATVTQGEEIPYQTTSDGTTSTSFKEAALKLQVTPSIIGDGNVLLTIQVNNDTPNRSSESDEPPINKMEIVTKLLVADGDIVVIGGIKKNVIANSKSQTPGLGNVPVIGNLFKGKSNSDNLDELLVFIAPRIL